MDRDYHPNSDVTMCGKLYLYHGFQGVWDLYPRAVVCLPEGEARGKTYNCPRVQIPYTLETHGTDDLCHSSFYSAR